MNMEMLFGDMEEHLRESQSPSVPDTEIDLGGSVMYASGVCAYLPRFHVTVHEGLVCGCGRTDGKFEPEYAVAAVIDKESGELLYDEEADFVECVYHWLEGKISIAELEKEKCVAEGIKVEEHEENIPAWHGGRSRQRN